MKSTFKELLIASLVLTLVVFLINLAGCASAQTATAMEAKTASSKLVDNSDVKSVSKSPAPIEKKDCYTKANFMQDLQSALDSEGTAAALALYDTKLPEELKDDFDLRFLKAAINLSANNLDEAERLCDELYKENPKNEDVLGLAATIAKLRGNTAARDKHIKALLSIDSKNAIANIEMASDFYSKKNYKQARLCYKNALAREPENMDALQGLGKADYYLENDKEAKSAFKKMLEIEPQNTTAFLYLGKIAYANYEYKVASNYVKKALEIDSESYEFNMDYGMYERFLGHYDVAEKAWSKAIEIQPDYFLAYAYRAGLYDEQEKIKPAINDYKKVLELNPKYYYAYESLGILALHDQQWTTAREAFEKCREFNSENISYPLMITYCFYKEGRGPDAQKFSDQVLRKMDRNSMEYAMLRVFHDRAGEKPLPQRISKLSSRTLQGKMYYYLGLFYDMFGGGEMAFEYYSKVVEMNSPMFFEYRLAEWRVKGKVGIRNAR